MNRRYAKLLVLAGLPFAAAQAQQNTPPASGLPPLRQGDKTQILSEDQYPGFIELTGKWVGRPTDTDMVIDCGYSVAADGKTILADVAGNDFRAQSDTQYGRYRRVEKDTIVISIFDPKNPQRYIFQVVRPDDSVTTKNCLVGKDSVATNCNTAQPFETATQARADMKETDDRCREILGPMTRRIDVKTYSRPKAEDYRKQQADKIAAVLVSH